VNAKNRMLVLAFADVGNKSEYNTTNNNNFGGSIQKDRSHNVADGGFPHQWRTLKALRACMHRKSHSESAPITPIDAVHLNNNDNHDLPFIFGNTAALSPQGAKRCKFFLLRSVYLYSVA